MILIVEMNRIVQGSPARIVQEGGGGGIFCYKNATQYLSPVKFTTR